MIENFENWKKTNEDENIEAINQEFGDDPSIEDVASYCWDNYEKITGLSTDQKNDEVEFPQEIIDIVEYFFDDPDWDEFEQTWGTFTGPHE
jgi:uncharacterized membrane-anchored protein YjiN (DUF445 family)